MLAALATVVTTLYLDRQHGPVQGGPFGGLTRQKTS
jgi:hypothetical protein